MSSILTSYRLLVDFRGLRLYTTIFTIFTIFNASTCIRKAYYNSTTSNGVMKMQHEHPTNCDPGTSSIHRYGTGCTVEEAEDMVGKRVEADYVDPVRCGLARDAADLEAAQDILMYVRYICGVQRAVSL